MSQSTVDATEAEARFTEADWLEYDRERLMAKPGDMDPEFYPTLDTFSAAFMYRFIPVPTPVETPPEYIYVHSARTLELEGDARARYEVFLTEWNTLWEMGAERRGMFDKDVPPELDWVMDLETDVRLMPRGTRNRYDAYSTLFHLLPVRTLRRFGLPTLRRGIWPYWLGQGENSLVFPADFDRRLERAVSYHLWPLLAPRGAPSAFSESEPIRLLSHNLDFWLPFADMVAQRRMRARGRVPFDNEEQERLCAEHQDKMPPGVTLQRPLFGGYVWTGEEEAWEATREMVQLADEHGHLRGILEAVRSHRIEDDFTERWSYEREDFERKLFRKRAGVRVRFVELEETVPVLGPDSEAHENLLWEDFFGLLNPKEREIVVCLRNGATTLTEVAQKLGYANHSPISKKLGRIRRMAERLLS